MRSLVIVAHADDELLFMGGTLHKYKANGWKLVCVTKDIEHGRDPQFRRLCKILGADGEILDFEMGWRPHVPVWDMTTLRERIEEIYHEEEWGHVYTHNSKGEYGHPQHMLVHDAVKSLGVPLRLFGEGHQNAMTSVMLSDEDREFKYASADVYTRKAKAIRAYPFFSVPYEKFAEDEQ